MIIEHPIGTTAYAVDSIALSSTITDGVAGGGVGYTSRQLPVHDVDTIILQGKATAGSGSGNVTFSIMGSADGVTWDTVAIGTLVVPLTSGATVVQSDPLDVSAYALIKLGTIQNGLTVAVTAVSLTWGKKWPNQF